MHAGGVEGFDAKTGKSLWSVPWKTPYDASAVTPTVNGSTVFISSAYGTGALALSVDGTGAKELWKKDKTAKEKFASSYADPIILDGYLYGYSGGDRDGEFKCLELKTGTEKWASKTLGYGACVYADGYLICLSTGGDLFLVAAKPEAFTKVAEFKGAVPGKPFPVWTAPVIANDKLYLRFQKQLICYDLRN